MYRGCFWSFDLKASKSNGLNPCVSSMTPSRTYLKEKGGVKNLNKNATNQRVINRVHLLTSNSFLACVLSIGA